MRLLPGNERQVVKTSPRGIPPPRRWIAFIRDLPLEPVEHHMSSDPPVVRDEALGAEVHDAIRLGERLNRSDGLAAIGVPDELGFQFSE